MPEIQVLDQITIDKIAAGEVIERPVSVVKELIENAIDAKATAITVEVKEGGCAFIRITDNGKGIEKEDIKNAFLRHATSKLKKVEDLFSIHTLGFRGEALSSISSVSQLQVITKRENETTGYSYSIHGGLEKEFEEVASVDGTTFLVRQLFYNTPARKKFLKAPATEAGYIGDLVTRLALSNPHISFEFINNGNQKLFTSGSNDVKDMIYRIYGRDIANNLIAIDAENSGVSVTGFIGKPVISRGNRNYENFFVNGRYVKSNIIAKAIEDGYKGYSMMHRYPFTVLHIQLDTNLVDVNVHPTKMELRFSNQHLVFQAVYQAIREGLNQKEHIPQITIDEPISVPAPSSVSVPEVKEETKVTLSNTITKPHKNLNKYGDSRTETQHKENLEFFMKKMKDRVTDSYKSNNEAKLVKELPKLNDEVAPTKELSRLNDEVKSVKKEETTAKEKITLKEEMVYPTKCETLSLFENKNREEPQKVVYKLLGQAFATYWLIEYNNQLYIIDQHAAHEKVLYEETMKNWSQKVFTTQYIAPPLVLDLSMQEKVLLETHIHLFKEIGFELEEFGQDSYVVRGVPANLFSIASKTLFFELLDQLGDVQISSAKTELITEKIASMSCKAAVKGKQTLSAMEVDSLISQLLTLENPFHCPHGRPVIIAMTKQEMDKKFKRIL